MTAITNHAAVRSLAIRNYWWLSVFGGMYFVGGFVLWGGTRAAIISSGIFVVAALVGLTAHYAVRWPSGRALRIGMILCHLLIAQAILIWQKSHLPLTDYTRNGNPEVRDLLIFLVSSLVVGSMSMFGGIWGALLGLATHYAFIFDQREEFSLKWAYPILIALAGNVVSSASWRLDLAYKEMERLANHDSLTGLFNRHQLVSEFERLTSVARETGGVLILVAWDLDGLKEVNDARGHAAGDGYIMTFARALLSNVRTARGGRASDAAFRVGGDEFISLHVDGPDGDMLRTRMHEVFASVSAGWVTCDGLSLDQAMTKADEALYANKQMRKLSGSKAQAVSVRAGATLS
jgi:diguanylate cyclase (GGDEF)-like protein